MCLRTHTLMGAAGQESMNGKQSSRALAERWHGCAVAVGAADGGASVPPAVGWCQAVRRRPADSISDGIAASLFHFDHDDSATRSPARLATRRSAQSDAVGVEERGGLANEPRTEQRAELLGGCNRCAVEDRRADDRRVVAREVEDAVGFLRVEPEGS